MSSAVNSAEFLHKQLENMCSHKEVIRDTPLFVQKNFCYAKKISVMQKIFCYAENFMLCRKIMQKVFCYAEISCYAEKFSVCRKIMQKVFLNAEKLSFYAEKMSFRHEPFTKTMSIVD